MGIVQSLIRIAPEALEQIQGNSQATSVFIFGENLAPQKPSLLQRILRKAPERIVVPARKEGDETDLDKSWDLLNFMLCGSRFDGRWPLNFLSTFSSELAPLELGLGPPMLHNPAEVKAIHEALSGLKGADLSKKFDPRVFCDKELYLSEMTVEEPEEMREYILENFHILTNFVGAAAEDGDAIIAFFN